MQRKLGIVGATGFIGGKLAEGAAREGWKVCGFSRSGPSKASVIGEWRQWDKLPDLGGLDALVNLSGHPIDQPWTERNRRLFHESRIGTTETLVRALRALPAEKRPGVLINGSAVGFYGDRRDEILAEDSNPGDGYLAELCREWEAAADPAEELGVRLLKWRTGVVLGRGGQAFEKMWKVFRLGLGGKLGDGRQWMPWIHIDDLTGGILYALGHARMRGPVNGSAPEVARNADFTRALGKAAHRPAIFRVPGFALRLVLDGFGGALLASQRAVPQALVQDGYKFRFPELSAALEDLARNA